MLYVLIEAQRAWLDKVQKDNELAKQETRIISEDKKSVETEPYGPGVLRPSLTKEPVSSLYPCQINDSEWFTLSPQKRLAWAKESKDPRISEGQRSPLEKRILMRPELHLAGDSKSSQVDNEGSSLHLHSGAIVCEETQELGQAVQGRYRMMKASFLRKPSE
nr:ZNRD1 antisense RNA 1 isoform X3 [Rattus norvegicus]